MAKGHKKVDQNLIEARCNVPVQIRKLTKMTNLAETLKICGDGENCETGVDSQVMINPFYTHFRKKKDQERILNTIPHAKNLGRFKSDRERVIIINEQVRFC